MKISFKADFRAARKELSRIQKQVIPKATVRAVNRTIEQVHTEAGRSMSGKYNIKKGEAKKSVRVTRRATMRNYSAEIQASGKTQNLVHFSARQTKKGVTFAVLKGGGRRLIRGAFIANAKSGEKAVFARGKFRGRRFVPSSARLPISRLQSVSVKVMFTQPAVQKAMERKAREVLLRRFHHEVQYLMSRKG